MKDIRLLLIGLLAVAEGELRKTGGLAKSHTKELGPGLFYSELRETSSSVKLTTSHFSTSLMSRAALRYSRGGRGLLMGRGLNNRFPIIFTM